MKVSDDVRSTHNQDGAVVLHIREGQMFRLNLVGSRILELLRQGHSEEEIAQRLSAEFRVSREIIVQDLREFVLHLEKHHLLERRSAQ